jgi:hypothetical protein
MNKIENVRDCIFALVLGMGVQTALTIWLAWSMYRDCQP